MKEKTGLRENLCRKPESGLRKAKKKSRLAAFLENEAENRLRSKNNFFSF